MYNYGLNGENMFNKAIYNGLLHEYVCATLIWNSTSNKDTRKTKDITKNALDTYIIDCLAEAPNNYVGDYEPIHSFFRDN